MVLELRREVRETQWKEEGAHIKYFIYVFRLYRLCFPAVKDAHGFEVSVQVTILACKNLSNYIFVIVDNLFDFVLYNNCLIIKYIIYLILLCVPLYNHLILIAIFS